MAARDKRRNEVQRPTNVSGSEIVDKSNKPLVVLKIRQQDYKVRRQCIGLDTDAATRECRDRSMAFQLLQRKGNALLEHNICAGRCDGEDPGPVCGKSPNRPRAIERIGPQRNKDGCRPFIRQRLRHYENVFLEFERTLVYVVQEHDNLTTKDRAYVVE